ncbi:MAG: QueT transporter family protein [Clostridia bacterium]|nr:QueT transporter family protein [Clostridia bacterium]
MRKSLFITQGALIAALYVALTYVANIAGLANGAIQLRISEALTVLPYFTPAAIPGLFIGCLIANLLTDGVLANIIVGSLATLIGAVGTRLLRKNKWLAAVPPILSNTIIVPFILMFAYHFPGSYFYFAFTVFIGEFITAGIFGTVLLLAIKSRAPHLF